MYVLFTIKKLKLIKRKCYFHSWHQHTSQAYSKGEQQMDRQRERQADKQTNSVKCCISMYTPMVQ